jgi:hypothetical protein
MKGTARDSSILLIKVVMLFNLSNLDLTVREKLLTAGSSNAAVEEAQVLGQIPPQNASGVGVQSTNGFVNEVGVQQAEGAEVS